MKKYVAEFIGTFALVFAGAGAIIINDILGGAITHLGISLMFGLIVMTVIFTIGDISGAHINPAVTLSFLFEKKIILRDACGYIAAQSAGAIAAAAQLRLLFGSHSTMGATLPAGSHWQSFTLEVMLTFFLMFVILNVSTGEKEKGITAAIAVGGTVGLEALLAGPITGASMNPARSLGPALISGNLSTLWIYIIAPVAGALLAVYVFRYLRMPQSAI